MAFWYCSTMAVGIIRSAPTVEWSEVLSDVDAERVSYPLEKIMRSKEWPRMCVGEVRKE